jgi:hypothetical protein
MVTHTGTAPLNFSFQVAGGFTTKLFKKPFGGTVGIIYNKTNRYLKLLTGQIHYPECFSVNYDLADDRYQQDVSAGALASLTFQFDPKIKSH